MRGIIGVACITLASMGAGAQVLEFPAQANRTAEQVETLASYRLPIGPWDGDRVQTIWAEGEITRQAWQLPAEGLTTLQLLAPLRQQLDAEDFDILYECEAQTCGGFDFRYAIDILPEPEMHVDLGDYRFIAAQRMGPEQPEYISLMVSRSSLRGFVQVIRVGPSLGLDTALFSASTKTPEPEMGVPAALATPLGDTLEHAGHAVLADLTFETGSARLGAGSFASLTALADYLLAHPDRSVVLVGHTDAEGGLDGNIALSRQRAQSVMTYLIKALNVPARQINAQGVGYLSPMASNLTDDGRIQNRRVEVILTSTR
ncbi:OmpA family protein [Actibacterium sp. D379-3]